MTFLKWLILIPICWISIGLGWLLCWLLPIFAQPEIGLCDNGTVERLEPRLPWWLSWFQTPDNSLYGDIGYRTEHRVKYNCQGCYLSMIGWLFRNPAYGFSWSILAASPINTTITTYGNPKITDGEHGISGWMLSVTDGAFRFRWILPLYPGRCFMLDCGWCMPQDGITNGKPLLFYGINPRFPKFKNG